VSDLAALDHVSSGKVRDIYAVGDDRLLLVASDRISTYDVVHPTPMPDKGKLLTGLTAFWLDRTGSVCPNHLISFTEVPEEFRGRAMLVERLEMVPVECVVRGYITGSGWKDYQSTGAVCGIELPEGLRESEQLPEPIFTPATKADTGHDVNISEEEAGRLIGPDLIGLLVAVDAAKIHLDHVISSKKMERLRLSVHENLLAINQWLVASPSQS